MAQGHRAGGEADIESPGLWTLRFLLSITLGWPQPGYSLDVP